MLRTIGMNGETIYTTDPSQSAKLWRKLLIALGPNPPQDIFQIGCASCKRGYIEIPKPDNSFGHDVKCCPCLFQGEHEKKVFELVAESGLQKVQLAQNPLNTHAPDKFWNDVIGPILKPDYSNKKYWAYIAGPSGTGKSTLSVALAQKALENEIETLYVSSPKMLDSLRPNNDNCFDYMKTLCTVPLLILDDFGQEKASEWVRERLFIILNSRYGEMLSTILVSNVSIKEIHNFVGEAISSRIKGVSNYLVLNGDDKR